MRIGDDKVVDSIYNRESISKIDLVQIDEYISYYAGILSNCLNEFVAEKSNMRSFAALLSQIVPEILSRLCIRCSIEKKYLLMDLLLQIYKSDRRTNFSGVNNLANRLIHSFSPNERLDLINKLLSFPIIDNNTLLRGNEFVNPIQFLDLSSQVVKEGQKPDIDTGRVQYFVESCRSENPGIRKWSIATLDVLYHLNLLEEDIVKAFSDCLWFKTDDTGFPSDTDYYKFAFLDLPHPESVDPVSLFRNYIKTANFPVQSKEKGAGISLTNGVDKLSKEILRGNKFIEWQGEEIQLLFSKIIEWWNADKHYLKKTDEDMLFSSVSSEFNKRFRNLMNILIFVISPNFNSNTDIIVKETLKRIIDEFRDFGLPTLRIKCAFCHVEKEMEFCIYDEIESYLTSNDRKQIIEGLQSILIIHKNDEKEMNSRFISILGQMFLWQKANCLAEVIDILTQLVKIHPDLYFTNIEKQVLIGLSNIADDNSDRFDFDTYLVIREKTAKMANTLFHLYSYNDKTIPDQILRWYERCQSDKEFPEIRNQWI